MPGPHGNGWGSLIAVMREVCETVQPPLYDCPNDGTELVTDRDGRLVCPFDGYSPEGRSARPVSDPDPAPLPSSESTDLLLDTLQGWA